MTGVWKYIPLTMGNWALFPPEGHDEVGVAPYVVGLRLNSWQFLVPVMPPGRGGGGDGRGDGGGGSTPLERCLRTETEVFRTSVVSPVSVASRHCRTHPSGGVALNATVGWTNSSVKSKPSLMGTSMLVVLHVAKKKVASSNLRKLECQTIAHFPQRCYDKTHHECPELLVRGKNESGIEDDDKGNPRE